MSAEPGTREIERVLRTHLERRAGAVQAGPVPLQAITAGIRSDRRRRTGAAALAVAGTVAVLLLALVVAGPLHPNRAGPAATRGWTVLTVPTAGDLAGDRSWLARAGARAESVLGGRVGHVIFAGRIPAGTVYLAAVALAGSSDYGAWALYSPTGSVDDLVQPEFTENGAGPLRVDSPDPGQVSVAVRGPDGTRSFLVVPLVPDARIAVSAGPAITPDGQVSRSWQQAPVSAGAAIGRLDPVVMALPQVRVNGAAGRSFLYSQTVSSAGDRAAVEAELARTWPAAGPKPSTQLVEAMLDGVLTVTDRRDLDLEPLYVGRELPSQASVAAAAIRLRGGAALQVAGLYQDHPPTPAMSTLLAGRAVPAALATRIPVTWLDDESFPGGNLHARARVVLPGAATVVIRDTGTARCAGGAVLGTGTPDQAGLTTIVVDVPAGCQARPPSVPWEGVLGYPDIVAIGYDRSGQELGRAPIQIFDADVLPGTR